MYRLGQVLENGLYDRGLVEAIQRVELTAEMRLHGDVYHAHTLSLPLEFMPQQCDTSVILNHDYTCPPTLRTSLTPTRGRMDSLAQALIMTH